MGIGSVHVIDRETITIITSRTLPSKISQRGTIES